MSFRSATDFLTTEWNVSSAVDIEDVAILKKNQPTTVASRRNTMSPMLVNYIFSLVFFMEFKELVVQELVVQELVGLGVGAGQSHVSSMNNLRVASQLQSYPSHIAYVYLELHL